MDSVFHRGIINCDTEILGVNSKRHTLREQTSFPTFVSLWVKQKPEKASALAG